MKKIIEIGAENVQLVVDRVAKLANKAQKIGATIPKISFSEPYFVTRTIDGNDVLFKVVEVTYEFEPIKVGNFTFIGTIDHTVSGNLVKPVIGQTIPKKFWDAECTCDHCNTTRNRLETFVFVDGDNYMRVGRQCLKAYFGIDPMSVFNNNQSFMELSEDESYGSGSSGEYFYSVEQLIAISIALVDAFGYRAKSSESLEDGLFSTATLVGMVLCPALSVDGREFADKYRAIADTVIKSGRAHEMIEWASNKFSTKESEYEHTMYNLLTSPAVVYKSIGYIASAVGAHVRENVFKKTIAESNHVGEVGKPIQTNVEVLKMTTATSAYGEVYVFKMVDSNGNILIWFASKCAFEVGDKITIKASVKNHSEYNGRKQTIITRAKQI